MRCKRISCGSKHLRKNRRRAFTLIELLVVVSVMALLTAILMASLRRAHSQARALVCQANLRQWGLLLSVYVSESEGRLPEWGDEADDANKHLWWWDSLRTLSGTDETARQLLFCPSATKSAEPGSKHSQAGGTFVAWGYAQAGAPVYGSYGLNDWFQRHPPIGPQVQRYIAAWEETRPTFRSTNDVRNADRIPVLLDSCSPWGAARANQEPAKGDAIPTRSSWDINSYCINRHNGRIGVLFLDWSARKIGLKELWTLKWEPDFDTAGSWTRAGGVKPEAWPQWMRQLRDY
jgi:prepilin-type N-terminal cleavage/methylation domain-containing protein/prepilin-type processing-associated H-X9-DG protein